MNKGTTSSSSQPKPCSEEMMQLLQHQKEISEWISSVKYRIYELETSYLDEPNSLGNVIRGWDADGRIGPIKKQISDEKDRLFSNSSYQVWSETKSQQEMENERKQQTPIIKTESINSVNKSQKNKKLRRASSLSSQPILETDSWLDQEDF